MKKGEKHSYDDELFEKLGRRIRAGDREAYREVFDSLHVPLARYAQGITGDEESAYDVLQDVFLKLWERRETMIPHTSLKAMLYTMVRNASLNVRRNRRRREGVPESGRSTPEDRALTVEARMEALDLSKRINRWIDDLPERRAEAFRLNRFAGLSHREIGLIMNVSERTVGTHILLALRYLRSRLDELEHRMTSA